MKCIVSIFMMCLFLFSACTPKDIKDDENISNTIDSQDSDEEIDSGETTQEESKESQEPAQESSDMDSESNNYWSSSYLETWDYNQSTLQVPYTISMYTPSIAGGTNLTSYDDLVNSGSFEGFTENQMNMLLNNGFVVLQPNETYPYLMMHSINEMLEYSDSAQFIAVDSVLHMYHVYYSEVLKGLEANEYYERLRVMTTNMFSKSIDIYNDVENLGYKHVLGRICVYFGVAYSLLEIEGDIEIPSEIKLMIDDELMNIDAAAGLDASEVFEADVDYSQYVVRGHYTQSEILTKYFKTMMWYGQTGFQLVKDEEGSQVVDMENTRISILITLMTYSANEKDQVDEGQTDIERWMNIYELTSFFSGTSDDLLLTEIADMILSVFGQIPTIEELFAISNESILEAAVLELREPQIVAKISNEAIGIPSGKQFRFMGQRYTLDADIIQTLMEPILRPIPSEFDVLSAFGNEKAEEILRANYKTNQDWPEYDDFLDDLKNYVASWSDDEWKSDIYHGMLWSIESASQSFEDKSGYPYFMTTYAWSLKNLSSGLGSLAELKHDNILYAKQPVAEMGGDFNQPFAYVEPNVEVFDRLLWLSNYTKENLIDKGIEDSLIISSLENMIILTTNLRDASISELESETLTQDQMAGIRYIGGLIDNLYYNLREYNGLSYDNAVMTSALVADTATIFAGTQGYYLEVGTGLPYEIYVLCHLNGKDFIAKGAVYSYYEFIWTERLTDETWWEMLGLQVEDFEYGSQLQYSQEPLIDLFETMPWVSTYISDEPNNVTETFWEVNWDE